MKKWLTGALLALACVAFAAAPPDRRDDGRPAERCCLDDCPYRYDEGKGAATHAADAARSAASGIPATTVAGRGVVPTNTVADITSTSAATTSVGPPTVPVGTGTMAVTTDVGCLNPLSAATGCPLAAFFCASAVQWCSSGTKQVGTTAADFPVPHFLRTFVAATT